VSAKCLIVFTHLVFKKKIMIPSCIFSHEERGKTSGFCMRHNKHLQMQTFTKVAVKSSLLVTEHFFFTVLRINVENWAKLFFPSKN